MVRRFNGRPTWLMAFAVCAALALAAPAAAQGTVRGNVKDSKGQPVEGAKVTIDMQGNARKVHFEAKTDKKGEFFQVGVPIGVYQINAEKDGLGSAPATTNVRLGTTVPIEMVLNTAAAAVVAQSEATGKVFNEGVALLDAGNHAGAIEKFTAAAQGSTKCSACYNNIGSIHLQDKEYDKAEAAFKQAVEVNPNDADAYTGLANVYNAQRKFEEAAAASKKASELSNVLGAAGGGNADALYNQGVALFNGGKPAEAKPLFQQAVQMKADHADAHFMLAQTLVGEANFKDAVAEYEMYLKLSPSGSHAKEAQDNVTTLKPLVK